MLVRIRANLISRAYARIRPYTGCCSLRVQKLLTGPLGRYALHTISIRQLCLPWSVWP